MVLFLTVSDCHCKTVLQQFCTQIISDVYAQCSRLKTSRPVPQGSLVGYWVLPTPLPGSTDTTLVASAVKTGLCIFSNFWRAKVYPTLFSSFVFISFFFYFLCLFVVAGEQSWFYERFKIISQASACFLFSLVIICLLSTSLSTLKPS